MRKREFLDGMDGVLPWTALVQMVEPYYPKSKTGRPRLVVDTLQRIHNLLPWFDLSDRAMEEALHHMLVFRDFAKLSEGSARMATDAPGTSNSVRISGGVAIDTTPAAL